MDGWKIAFPIEIVPSLGIFIDFTLKFMGLFPVGVWDGLFSGAFVLLVLESVTVRPLKGLPFPKGKDYDKPSNHPFSS